MSLEAQLAVSVQRVNVVEEELEAVRLGGGARGRWTGEEQEQGRGRGEGCVTVGVGRGVSWTSSFACSSSVGGMLFRENGLL